MGILEIALIGVAAYEVALQVTNAAPIIQPDPLYEVISKVWPFGCKEGLTQITDCIPGFVFSKKKCKCVENTCGCGSGYYEDVYGNQRCVMMGMPEMVCPPNTFKRGRPYCDCAPAVTTSMFRLSIGQCNDPTPKYTQAQLIALGINVLDYHVTVPAVACAACSCPGMYIYVKISASDVSSSNKLTGLGFQTQ